MGAVAVADAGSIITYASTPALSPARRSPVHISLVGPYVAGWRAAGLVSAVAVGAGPQVGAGTVGPTHTCWAVTQASVTIAHASPAAAIGAWLVVYLQLLQRDIRLRVILQAVRASDTIAALQTSQQLAWPVSCCVVTTAAAVKAAARLC